jgi:hypothetical protein
MPPPSAPPVAPPLNPAARRPTPPPIGRAAPPTVPAPGAAAPIAREPIAREPLAREPMSSTAATVPSMPTVAPAAGERKPINPFLANDPNQKAKRLARALVSDILAYHPGKREEGLANGTLKQIFREEIKKSYEEYVEQIGKEFAESTSHFQDALNELLAGGKKLF